MNTANGGVQNNVGIQDQYLRNYWDSVFADYSRNNKDWNAPYLGETVTPMSQQTQQALGNIWGIAQQPNYINNAAMRFTGGILNGKNSVNTEGDLRRLLGQSSNKAFGGVLDTQAGKLTDNIDRQFSNSGRYGSAAHSGTVADQVGDFRAKAVSDNWNQNIQNQSNILGQIGGVQNQNVQNGLAASQMAGQLYNNQFAGADRMASVGAQYDDLRTRQNAAAANLWDAQHNQSWRNLQTLGGLLGAAGGGGGSGQVSVSQPSNYLQSIGGALGGAGQIADFLKALL